MTRSQRIALALHYVRSARYFAAYTRNWTQEQALNEAFHRAYPEWRILAASLFPPDTPLLRAFPDNPPRFDELFAEGKTWAFDTDLSVRR